MKLSLIVLNPGKTAGQVIPITLAQFVIGRDPQCQLRPNNALISKRHCAILVRDGTVYVRDFDSTNGTILNDAPLKGEVAVKNGDVMKVGPLEFRLAIEGARSTLAPRTPPPKLMTVAIAPPTNDADVSNDDIGDMLLEMSGSEGGDHRGVPDGSTIMDLPLPSALSETTRIDTKQIQEAKKIPAPTGNAQSAAADLFARLNKRVR